MKKITISLLSLAIAGNLSAQAPKVGTTTSVAPPPLTDLLDLEQPNFYKYHPANLSPSAMETKSSRGGIEFIPIGTAYNLFTILLDGQNQVSYHPDINSVSFVHRQNNGTSGGSGGVSFDLSTDGGATWSSNTILTPDYNAGSSPVTGNRYPSAALYNIPGNTDPDLAFIVANGPALDPASATASWGYTFRISATLDGNNIDEQYYQTAGEPWDFHPYGINYYGSGSLWSISTTYNNTGDAAQDILTYQKYRVNEITPDLIGMEFDYNTTDVEPDFYTYTATSGFEENMAGYGWGVYFDPTGVTGYVVLLGAPADADLLSIKPIIYKTTDAGATWNLLPDFNFGSLTTFQDWTIPTWEGEYLPFFTSYDAAVDNEGTLHLFTEYISRSTTSTEADSLFFIWNGFTGFAHMTTTDGSDWDATLLGYSQLADGLLGTVNIPYRVQTSSTPDGSKIFFTRTMSDSTIFAEHSTPDLLVIGYDIVSGEYTNEINFSAGTDFEYSMYFATTSPVTMDNGSGEYEIPIVIAEPGADENSPPQFHYVKGVTFVDADFGAEPAPVANFTYSIGTAGAVAFSNTSMNASTYSWDFGDGSAASPLENPTYTYLANGVYEVCLTASNATTSDTNCKDVEVSNIGNSVHDAAVAELNLFPSPASAQLTLQLKGSVNNASITIFNLYGEAVTEAFVLKGQSIDMDVSNLPEGNYLVQLNHESGIITRQIAIVR